MNATMSPRVAFRGVCLPVLGFLLLSAFLSPAQEEEKNVRTRKVNSERIELGKDELAYVRKGLSHEEAPFTGIAFTEGSSWRAEVTYKDGILDGPVTVVVNQKVFSQFRYEKGKKVLE
jgi:hypothetical protein